MHRTSKIYVAGHRGLVGSAFMRRLQAGGYTNLITRNHAELNLTDQRAVQAFFAAEKPDFVFLAAAKVGGIHANNTYPAEFIYQNLMIETSVIHAAYLNKVTRLLFLGSSCIYPKHAPQPMKEEYLLTGQLESTNESYALAKIAGIKLCAAYNRQYGTDFLCAMPTNLYGSNDNYDLENSHVIPALIRKMHDARERGASDVEIWGSGTPRREFMFSDDLADACVFLMEHPSSGEVGEFINVGVGHDMSIAEIARAVANVVGFRGGFKFNTAMPDGTPKKLLDVSRLNSLGWSAKTGIKTGLEKSYEDFKSRQPSRGNSQ